MSSMAATIADRKLSSSEVELGRLCLEQSRIGILGAIQGLSKEQWHFKPAAEQWSIAEILEHVVVIQNLVKSRTRDLVAGQIGNAPAADRDLQVMDEMIVYRFPARLAKVQGPDFARPTGQLAPLEALEKFGENCEALAEALDWAGLREAVLEARPMKIVSQGRYDSMDGYQWLLTAAAHTERHAKQILEVRANPNFPTD
jgi:hypothetical protein